MNREFENLAARAAPAIFVVLWSTGFIGTKYVLHNAEPLTYLTIRMALVVGLMAIIVAIARPVWPNRSEIGHSIIAGILVHGFYLGGIAVAISLSIPAGLSALIPGLQPILTSTLANRWLGERVTPLQWTGLLLGLAGVVLILHDRPMSGEAGWGWLASGVSLVSITLGTLYQRRYCNSIDWRSGNLVQYVAVTVFFGIGAWLFETNVVHWTSEFVLSRGLARGGAVDRVDRAVVLADPAPGGDLGGEPVLSGAGGDRRHGLCPVRRTARYHCDYRHGGLRRRGVCGQPSGLSLTAKASKQRPPGFHPEASGRDAGGDQRFDFLAFFFFLAAFFAVFLTAFLADFFAEDFLADFLPAFFAFLAFFFGAALVTAFLAAFLAFLATFFTFLTTVLAASAVVVAALLTASVT